MGGGGGASSATVGCTISHVTLNDMAALPDGVPQARGTAVGLPTGLPCNLLASCGQRSRRARRRYFYLVRGFVRCATLVAEAVAAPETPDVRSEGCSGHIAQKPESNFCKH